MRCLIQKTKGADDAAPFILLDLKTYSCNFTSLSCCSVGHGALVGTSVAASLDCTILLSIKKFSTSSPLTSGSIVPLISTQGESGCPLLVSISQRNAGFWMMSFSVYLRLYFASTARTPPLQPQEVFKSAVI